MSLSIRRAPFLIILLLLLLTYVAGSQISQNPVGVEISGVVLDAHTGQGLPDASIYFRSRSTSADSEGHFKLSGVPPGRYLIAVSRAGYLMVGSQDDKTGMEPLFHPDGIRISVGSDMPRLVLRMRAAPVVSGRIVDARGQPQEAVEVTPYRLIYDELGRQTLSRTNVYTVTDDIGEFKVEALAPGNYLFGMERSRDLRSNFGPAYYPGPPNASRIETVELKTEGDLRVGEIVLPTSLPGARLNIRLLDERGQLPSANAFYIALRRQGDLTIRNFFTYASQSLRLPQGIYSVEGGIVVGQGSTRTVEAMKLGQATIEIRDNDVDLQLIASPGAKVTGQVYTLGNNGKMAPASAIQIRLTSVGLLSNKRFKSVSNSDGRFVFPSIPAGSYRFHIPLRGDDAGINSLSDSDVQSAPQLCVSQIQQDGKLIFSEEVQVPQTTTNIAVTLREPASTISGKAVNRNGQPAEGAVIALIPDSVEQHWSFSAVTSDQDGNFRFPCAQPGTYKLYAWSELSGAAYRNDSFMQKYGELGYRIRLAQNERITVQVPLLDR